MGEPDLKAAGADERMRCRCVSRAGTDRGVVKELGQPRPGCTDGRQTTHTEDEGQINKGKRQAAHINTHTLALSVFVCVCFRMMMIMVHQAVLESHTSLLSLLQRPVCCQPSDQ